MITLFDAAVVRKILPVAAIGASLIYALNAVVLEPDSRRLEEVRGTLARTRASAEASGTLRMAQSDLEQRLSEFRGNIREVQARSEAGTDQRELFDRVSELAREAHIDLEQVRAMDTKPRSPATKDGEPQCAVAACSLELTGTYDELTSFVGAVEARLGLTAVTRLKIRPAVEGERVRAEIEIACFSMDRAATASALSSVMAGEEESR